MKIVIRQIKMSLKYRIVLKLIYYFFPIVFIMKKIIYVFYINQNIHEDSPIHIGLKETK